MAQVEFFEKRKVLGNAWNFYILLIYCSRLEIHWMFRFLKGFVDLSTYSGGTVDGRNPAPPGMYKTL